MVAGCRQPAVFLPIAVLVLCSTELSTPQCLPQPALRVHLWVCNDVDGDVLHRSLQPMPLRQAPRQHWSEFTAHAV